MEKFNRLKEILRAMFQLDRGDLDFGLYRIMNMKAAEIADFLDNDLLPQVQDALTGNAQERQAELEKELAQARAKAIDLGADPEAMPKVRELQQQLAEVKADVAAEADVYNHLANFFARYYDEGDFMSLRRYSGGGQSSYLIPYDGEEVKLHWANSDQYYIKTTENYASYVFSVGPGDEKRRVRFEIAKADNEKDNIKEAGDKQRRFLLAEGGDEETIEIVDSDLVVRFAHRPLTENEKKTWKGNGNKQQELINKAAAERILNSLEPAWQVLLAVADPTENNPDRTVLDKHLATYTAKNSFDYFIHKDLGGFLRRELDLYLKTDVLNLDDLAAGDTLRLQRALARTRAVRHVADKIITFLAQIEDFQKQLWLKKKFVLETQYCVTLDRVPETLYPEIAANEAQHYEWLKLFAIDGIEGNLANGNTSYTNPLTVDFLKANPYLVLDTRHFDRDFTDRLLAALSDAAPLDEQLDGLLVHGENFQALSFLQNRYREQIRCVYIDPPYNAKSSEIIYKNSYKHSSWLSLIQDRARAVLPLYTKRFVHVTAIDEVENFRLGMLFGSLYPDYEDACISIVHNPTGQQGNNFSYTHEFAHFVFPRDQNCIGLEDRDDDNCEATPDIRPLRNVSSGKNHLRESAANCFYPIYVKDGEIVGFGEVCDDNFHPAGINQKGKDGVTEVYPIDPKGVESKWVFARNTVESIIDELSAEFNKEKGTWDIIRKKSRFRYKSLWNDTKYSANSWGSVILNNMLPGNLFTYPKSIFTVRDCVDAALNNENSGNVLDYFAGSGTTGHAVINLNREDEGERKYILVEVGAYFDNVLLPRIKKVVYSPDWKDGKPVSCTGSSQFFKYIRLESYEDTLDSLELIPPDSAQQDLLAQNPALEEDYRLRYALGEETVASACLLGKYFTDPFAYTLSVVRDGVRGDIPVDLPETFNFLIGLRSASRRKVEDVLAITGTDAEGRCCLILWRNLDETDNPALDAWFNRNRESFGELDVIYTNGDHTLNALKEADESWIAKSVEAIFRELMFKEKAT